MTQASVTHAAKKQQLKKEYPALYRFAVASAILLIGVWLGSTFFSEGYSSNVFTELLGLIATYLIFDHLTKNAARRETKEQLLAELRSTRRYM